MDKKQLIKYYKNLEGEIKQLEQEVYGMAHHVNEPDPNMGNDYEGSDMQYNISKSKFRTGIGEKLPDNYIFNGRIDKSLPTKFFDESGNIQTKI